MRWQWLQLLVFVSEGACFDRAMPSVSLLCAWLVLGVCAWVVLREPYDPRGVFSVSIAPVTSADTRGSK